MGNVDFSLIAGRALNNALSIVQQLFPLGKLEGHEWRLGGLDGSKASNKGSLSININTGAWSDFATGNGGGDLISLLAARDGMSQKDAAEELSGMIGLPTDNLEKKRQVKKFISSINPPSDPTSHNHYRHQAPNKTWIYRNAQGERMFYIHRFDIADGHKEICPQTYGELDGKKGWFWRQVNDPRPLYGLDNLAKTKATVIVTEGEKCADALANIAGTKVASVSWSGGTNAVDKADWSALKGRKVVIWPDADKKTFKGTDKIKPLKDQPGYKAAQRISYLALKAGAADVLVLEFDYEGLKDGWDVADAIADGWGMKEVVAFITKGIENGKKKEPQRDEMSNEERLTEKEKEVVKGLEALPFDCLGYNSGNSYYRPHKTQQLKVLSESSHTKQNLLYMAPLEDWRKAYPMKNRPFFDQDQATSDMFGACQDVGPFDMEKMRGRGAWLDEGRVIFHCGDKILVDGVMQDTMAINESRFIYELKGGFSPPSMEGITDKEAYDLFEAITKFRWTNPLFAKILLGWCIMAPFCGAFQWRPHIWLNATAGAGKTWILDNVINKIIGDYSLNATSVSTEAGIRSKLQSDARPVILDEAEAQDAAGAQRLQKIMELARQSSSESDARIIKGTAGGGSIDYRVRSCFCISSIGVSLHQAADQSRFTMLYLDRPEKLDQDIMAMEKSQFKEAERFFQSLSPEFIDKIHGRTLKLLKPITETVDNYTAALATLLHSQRDGDQLGTLLGVADAWLEGKVIGEEEAYQRGEAHRVESLIQGTIESDDRRCLDHLMDQKIKVRAEKKGVPYDLTIAEIIEALRFDTGFYGNEWNQTDHLGPTPDECESALAQCGLRIAEEKKALLVANNHVFLAHIYKDTQWTNSGWPNSLKQIEHADNNDGKAVRIAGSSRKCVRVYLPGKEE